MHFDVIVEANTPHEKAIEYGKEYLNSVDQEAKNDPRGMSVLSYLRAPPVVAKDIKDSGYFIQKMEGCP